MTVVSQKHKKKARHPRGAGSAGPSRRTGQRAGRPEPVLGSYEHPVVSPQFSHLWQVPLRTVSQPQRGQGGASGVEFMRRAPGPLGTTGWDHTVSCAVAGVAIETAWLSSSSCGAGSTISLVRTSPIAVLSSVERNR